MAIDPVYIGYAAATLATAAFVPQVHKSIVTNDTKAISLVMYLMFCTGVFLWMTYGVIIGDRPLIVANIITFTLAAIVLFLKIRNMVKHGER